MRIHFGNNEHAIALTLDCVGHDFFRAAFAVHFGGIDQRHTELDSEPQCGHFILVRPRVLAHAPGALTQHGYGFAIGKGNCPHVMLLLMIVIDLVDSAVVDRRYSIAWGSSRALSV